MCDRKISEAFYAVSNNIGPALSLAIAASEFMPGMPGDGHAARGQEVASWLVEVQKEILEKMKADLNTLEGALMAMGLAP